MAVKIDKDMVASVHYTGTLTDSGEEFDSSKDREPLTFLVGYGQMIPGFEEEMMGAKLGDKRDFTLTPDRAYGARDDEAVLKIPRSQFAQLEQSAKLDVGTQLVAQMPHGPAPFTVTELDDESITADFNHALAGKSLNFSVEVVELRSATESEISHGHIHPTSGEETASSSGKTCNDDGCC